MRTVTWLALTPLLLAAACARPATAPATDALTEWLMTSTTAEVVGDAAREQGWLSAAPVR
jgi:hypothetical protein